MHPMRIYLLLMAILLMACGNHSHSDKKIFRYNESSGITSLDPLKATNLSNIWAVQQVYEGLTMIDSVGKLQPLLADSWQVSDSMRTYSFQLKKNIFFHNDDCFKGKRKKFSAFDVVYSYERILGSSSKWVLQNIQMDSATGKPGIEIKDSFSITIHLNDPSATFPQMLAMPPCGIVPKEAVDFYGKDFRSHPVGTGPFVFYTWHENEKLIFHKNNAYHIPGIPLIDAISISFLKDKQTALLEFIRGKFDFISGIDAAYKDELLMGDGKLNPAYLNKINLTKQPYLNTEYLGIRLDSTSNTPLQNIHIRKALNYGLDRERLVKFIRNGVGVPGHYGIVPPVLFSKTPDAGYRYDKQKFEEEIKAAGYPDPNSVPAFRLSADVAYTDVCTYIINQWNELGLHVQLEILDRPTLKSEVAKGNLEFFRASWIADYPHAENYLSLFYGPLKSPAGPNYTHFQNATYDRMFKQSSSASNDSIYFLMDHWIMEQAPVIILYYDQVVHFTNKRVKNLPPHPMNYLDLRRVDIR